MSLSSNVHEKAGLIWAIADKLTGVYKPHEYGEVILPLTVIRRFSEAHNEDAGQHYTPREVIRLMVNLLFCDDSDILSGKNVARTIYDPACGTGGMLSVAEEYLRQLNATAQLVAFGQEISDQTFAICKADMLIKGDKADFIMDGNTLSDDQFAVGRLRFAAILDPFENHFCVAYTIAKSKYF